MPNSPMQLQDIRTAAQQLADMVNSNYVTTAEWNSYINQSAFSLYDRLVSAFGDDYFVALPAPTNTTDGINSTFALPDGVSTGWGGWASAPPKFYKLLGVDLAVSMPDWWVTLRPFEMAERNRFSLRNFQSFYGLSNLRYRLIGNSQIYFSPIPAAAQTYRLWYVPQMVTMVADIDTMPADISGWGQWVILDAAIKARQKEESDTTTLMMLKAQEEERIDEMARNRDAGFPHTVQDTQRSNPWTPWGGPMDGAGGWW